MFNLKKKTYHIIVCLYFKVSKTISDSLTSAHGAILDSFIIHKQPAVNNHFRYFYPYVWSYFKSNFINWQNDKIFIQILEKGSGIETKMRTN